MKTFSQSPEGLVPMSQSLFIDAECPCKRSELYEYVIVIYDEAAEVAGDFIQKYRMWPLEPRRFDAFNNFDTKFGLSTTKVWKRIKSFTIADAFKYIQQYKGESTRPSHRVLDFDESSGNF